MTLESAFAAAMPAYALRDGCVQVAFADVDDWQAWEDEADALLDAHDRNRVARQRMPRERTMRTLAYALHRLWLAGTLGCNPAEVPLYRDPMGCPRLVGDRVWTSLSHAGGQLAFAVGRCGPVGVDIEPAARGRVMHEIAEAVCHPDDWRHLSSRPAPEQAAMLLELWVRKEAVLKAVGVGLRVPMASFAAVDRASVHVPGFSTRWQARTLDAGPNAVAAVATRDGAHIECFRLRPGADAAAVPRPTMRAAAS